MDVHDLLTVEYDGQTYDTHYAVRLAEHTWAPCMIDGYSRDVVHVILRMSTILFFFPDYARHAPPGQRTFAGNAQRENVRRIVDCYLTDDGYTVVLSKETL